MSKSASLASFADEREDSTEKTDSLSDMVNTDNHSGELKYLRYSSSSELSTTSPSTFASSAQDHGNPLPPLEGKDSASPSEGSPLNEIQILTESDLQPEESQEAEVPKEGASVEPPSSTEEGHPEASSLVSPCTGVLELDDSFQEHPSSHALSALEPEGRTMHRTLSSSSSLSQSSRNSLSSSGSSHQDSIDRLSKRLHNLSALQSLPVMSPPLTPVDLSGDKPSILGEAHSFNLNGNSPLPADAEASPLDTHSYSYAEEKRAEDQFKGYYQKEERDHQEITHLIDPSIVILHQEEHPSESSASEPTLSYEEALDHAAELRKEEEEKQAEQAANEIALLEHNSFSKGLNAIQPDPSTLQEDGRSLTESPSSSAIIRPSQLKNGELPAFLRHK